MKHYRFLDLAKVNAPYKERLVEAATRVIESGRYIGGHEVEEFERSLGELLDVRYVVGVSNGLDALRLTLRGFVELGRLAAGDGVIVPANTYIASVLAITDAGLRPVLVDPSLETMNLDAEGMRRGLAQGGKAVMPVHLYGRVAWDDEMRGLVEDEGLIVLEDCAQAIGARSTAPGLYGTFKAGGLGHAGALSFYPTKNTGALGDAGAVVTHDEELAGTVRALANYGADRRYHNIYQGFNCRMDPMQGALLRVKLSHVELENADRFARALVYDRTIDREDLVKPLMSRAVTDCVWHQYVVRVADGKRDCMMEALRMRGVETDIHYAVPPHMQPCYKSLAHGPLTVTERLAGEVLSLPIATGTSLEDAAEIAEIINDIDL
ncbi:MAG: DegT/DnrJ/EryC1/StrS family aminotransferase [Muribaculaceae bacterium]|nr:DegT/DnrJ/EryC1/StrS family aminotransferase [Muribaculaceae bacterium]